MPGASNGCGWNTADRCATTSAGLIGWLKLSATSGGTSYRPPGRYQSVRNNRAVGVRKEKVKGCARRRPLIAAAAASIVTVYSVASGSARDGVKIRIVDPDQRNVPATAGVM